MTMTQNVKNEVEVCDISFEKRTRLYIEAVRKIIEKEGGDIFQKKIEKNGYHPEVKEMFDKLFPDTVL